MLNSREESILNGLLHAVGERQELLANNLTNIRSKGYARKDIDFHFVLSSLENADENQNPNFNSIIKKATFVEENKPMSLEKELAAMTENHLKYILLTRINGHIYKHLEEATQSGRAA